MSWAEGRETNSGGPSREELLRKISHVNGVLRKLTTDDYLHKILVTPIVKAAIDHWTNVARQTPEKAKQFEQNGDVIYVLQRMQLLQHTCRTLCIAIDLPLAHMYQRKAELTEGAEFQIFGIYSKRTETSKIINITDEKIDENSNVSVEKEATEPSAVSKVSSRKAKSNEVENLASQENPMQKENTVEKEEISENVSNEEEKQEKPVAKEASAGTVQEEPAVVQKGSFQYWAMWGHEDSNSPDFHWGKWLLRTLMEFAILGALSRIMAVQYAKYKNGS